MVDQGIINRAAIEAGVPRVAIEELEYEGQRSLVEQMLRIVYGMPAIPTTLEALSEDAVVTPRVLGSFLSPVNRPMSISMREYVRMVGMVIRDLAHSGNIIVVGQGGQMVLRDSPGVLHVQVVAPFVRRLATLMEREDIDRREATARLRASDRARADYIQRYHGCNWLDPMLYDLLINTDHLPLPAAVTAVVGACQSLNDQNDNPTPS
jgi:cytidylate kinase